MILNKACKCGVLGKLVSEKRFPFSCDLEANKLFLTLGHGEALEIHFCPMCGGQDISNLDMNGECSCFVLLTLANTQTSSVKYDATFNEYRLDTGIDSCLYFSHCPFCGKSLPPSRRDEYFTIPSELEVKVIKEKLKEALSVHDIIGILGKPDHQKGEIPPDIKAEIEELFDVPAIKQTASNTSLSETFDLIVQEYEGGEMKVLFLGKYNGPA